MRKIKFRAWFLEEKKMVLNPEFKGYAHSLDDIFNNPKMPVIWLQYTGLKDKNGKEIYEGDIVRLYSSCCAKKGDRTFNFIETYEHPVERYRESMICGVYLTDDTEIVKWQELSGFYPFADHPDNCGHCGGSHSPDKVEVIGNIYENPELIK